VLIVLGALVLAGCGSSEEGAESTDAAAAGEAISQIRSEGSEAELAFLRAHRGELEQEARAAGLGEELESAEEEAEEEASVEHEFGEDGTIEGEPAGAEVEGEEEIEYGEDGEPVAQET
jgi:hypothetical protein